MREGPVEERKPAALTMKDLVDAYRIIREKPMSAPPKPLLRLEDAIRMLRECETREEMEKFAWEHCIAVI